VDVFTINRKRAMCSTAPVAGTYPGVLWLPALTPMANVRPGCRQVARSVNDTHVCDALHAQTSRQRSRRREKEETGESSDILQRRSGTQAETALANRYKRLSSTAASYACLKNDVSYQFARMEFALRVLQGDGGAPDKERCPGRQMHARNTFFDLHSLVEACRTARTGAIVGTAFLHMRV